VAAARKLAATRNMGLKGNAGEIRHGPFLVLSTWIQHCGVAALSKKPILCLRALNSLIAM
jgi:hypothetical protein